MIPWFQQFWHDFWYDQSWPERALRALVALVGQLGAQGVIPLPPKWAWAGNVLTAAALLINAGQKNPKPAGE